MKVLLVGNVLTHYRLPLYEHLQGMVDLDLLFYSDGQEWYWQNTSTPAADTLKSSRQLRGVWIGRTRLTPGLIPAVLRADVDVVVKDPNGKFALPATYVTARLRRRPFVLWASLWEHPTTRIHRMTRPLMRYLYRHSDAVVTYGRHVSRHVVAEGADPSRVFVSPQAARSFPAGTADVDRWTTPLRLLFVGRLEAWKGLDSLLRAAASLPGERWTLEIVGEGSERAPLESLATTLGIAGNVTFLGHVPYDGLAEVYGRAAAVVVPSRRTPEFSEPWSLVVNEAMQAGALVVTTDAVGAARDGLVTDGETGIVVPEGDDEALARALKSLLDQGAAERYVPLAQAGQRAVADYSHAAAAEAFVVAANAALAHRASR